MADGSLSIDVQLVCEVVKFSKLFHLTAIFFLKKQSRPQDLEVVNHDVSRFDVSFASIAYIDRCNFFRLYLGLSCFAFYS